MQNLENLKVVVDYPDHESFDSDRSNSAITELEQSKNERLSIIPEECKDDGGVRRLLKLFNEPEQLVDESTDSRRDRLAKFLFANKSLLYRLKDFNPLNDNKGIERDQVDINSDEEEEEDFYTPATNELIQARKYIIKYSLTESEQRLKKQRSIANTIDIPREIKRRRTYNKQLQSFSLVGSQIASTRPVSKISVSPKGGYFATGSWAGDIKILDVNSLDIIHNSSSESVSVATGGKIGGLDWNHTGSYLVSGSDNTYVSIHHYQEDPNTFETVSSFKAHDRRVVTTKFHPSDRYIASTSFDTTWKLWDLETSKELLLQEGHAKEVYSLAFHRDGALVCTGGLDNLAMLWDLRSGSLLMTLSGHVKPIYTVDWSPNGYNLATGSGDGSIHIWDLRKQGICGKILAHNNIVTSVEFEPSNGECLISSSYDKTINIFSSGNWNKITSLKGHTDKILDVSFANNSQCIISSGWDRSVKLWEMNH